MRRPRRWSAEQRRLFEETLAEDEASLLALLRQAKGEASSEDNATTKRAPRRKPLPDELRRVVHHHEPENTNCPSVPLSKNEMRLLLRFWESSCPAWSNGRLGIVDYASAHWFGRLRDASGPQYS